MRISKKILVCSALLSLMVIDNCFAQKKPVKKTLDEVVVYANRLGQTKKNTSQQTFVIKAPEISFSNSRSMAELLSEFGTISVQKSQQGGGSPIIRGFESSRVLLVVDNIRMNSLIFRSGHLQNSLTLQPYDIDQLSIMYGPSSVAFGSDALGGVIHVKTKSPQLSLTDNSLIKGHFSHRISSASNEKTSHFDFNIGSKKWASYTSMTYSDFGDLQSGKSKNPFISSSDSYIYRHYSVQRIDGKDVPIYNPDFTKQLNSGYQQFDLLQKILFQPRKGVRHLFNVQYSETSPIPRYDRLTDMKGGKPKYAEWYYGNQERFLSSYHLDLANVWGADKINLVAAYQHLEESRMKRKFQDVNLFKRMEDVDMFSVSFDWAKQIKKNSLHLGVEGDLQFLKSTAETKNVDTKMTGLCDTRYPGGDNSMANVDIFAYHQYNFTPILSLREGVRIGYSSLYAEFTDPTFYPFQLGGITQNSLTYSGSLGLNYTPKGWKFATQLSSAYRVPNIDDMGKVFDSSSSDQIVVIPNTNIDPEKTITLDLNITKYIGDNLTWENVIFATYLFDAIALDYTTLNGIDHVMYDGEKCRVVSNQNHDKGYLYGISSNLKWQLTNYLGADLALNYTRGRTISKGQDKPMSHIAPLFGRIGFTYQTLDRNFKASCYTLFNGKKSIDDYNIMGEDNLKYATVLGEKGTGLPAWATLNLKIAYMVCKKIEVNVGIENILDYEYRAFASGINASGRNFFVTGKIGF